MTIISLGITRMIATIVFMCLWKCGVITVYFLSLNCFISDHTAFYVFARIIWGFLALLWYMQPLSNSASSTELQCCAVSHDEILYFQSAFVHNVTLRCQII